MKNIFSKVHFVRIVILRFMIILFRKNKELVKLTLDFNTENQFENSYIIINYRFRNAIYYKFGKHITLEKEIKIFNLKNFENEFQLTVYGFFRKKSYKLKFEPKLTLENSNFKTFFLNLKNDFEFKTMPNLSTASFRVELLEIEIKPSKLKITPNRIVLKHETFNQNHFI